MTLDVKCSRWGIACLLVALVAMLTTTVLFWGFGFGPEFTR